MKKAASRATSTGIVSSYYLIKPNFFISARSKALFSLAIKSDIHLPYPQQPLRIDLLVIKKTSNVQIKNEIGHIFRGHNLIEYKSEDDEMNIDTLFKVIAYGCLYKAYAEDVD